MSLLVICGISGHFVNTLTSDDKYYLRNSENLLQPIQMKLSKKQKKFTKFFGPLMKSISNFKHFEKNNDPHSLCISGITDCQILGYTNV